MIDLKQILHDHQEWVKDNNKGKRAKLFEADLPKADLYGANLSKAVLSGANLYSANISGANLSGASLYDADLYGANISGANLSDAVLSYADLFGANISGANLSDAVLSYADLFGANLSRANLSRADLSGADLSRANLSRADLSEANLFGANLYGANLSETVLDPTRPPNADVKGFSTEGDFVIGYRTRKTPHIGNYLDGRIYAADWFSTCPDTECHPGLYLWPSSRAAQDYSVGCPELIRVRTKAVDVHHVGNKWRCRWFEVLGAVAQN